jgi:signal transduction histidine kinase
MLRTHPGRVERLAPATPPSARRPDLLAVVAHDLRQPVSAALMAAEFVEELLDDCSSVDVVRTQIALVQRCARETLRLAEDLLTMGQVEAGALRLRPEPVHVKSLLEDAWLLVAPHARLKRIELRMVAPDSLPRPVADRNRLLQVVTNLCGNAVKFTPAGGRIQLVATSHDAVVRIAVTDNGAGIAEGDLPCLFDQYWQGAGGDRRAGAGLGLAIAKWLVEAHGGRIVAEPAPGGGSTMAFTIPIGEVVTATETVAA